MRELLFKNLTSLEKGRKVICISDLSSKDGYLAHTQRQFIYLVRDAENIREALSNPVFYILKIHDSKQKKEKLFFKVKGNFFVVADNHIRIVYFCHSFKIELSDISKANHQIPH
ncbi:MAG: hypothetical protein Q8O13_08995 [Candidatus Omnitrophota bacterium]|nr:hypothetical protein [Candidatus Omnitrophota bacterium]